MAAKRSSAVASGGGESILRQCGRRTKKGGRNAAIAGGGCGGRQAAISIVYLDVSDDGENVAGNGMPMWLAYRPNGAAAGWPK
jgi:hypothetical protein